jgi:hypothetical protein
MMEVEEREGLGIDVCYHRKPSCETQALPNARDTSDEATPTCGRGGILMQCPRYSLLLPAEFPT